MYWGLPCIQWFFLFIYLFYFFLRHEYILWRYIMNQGPFVRKHQLWFYFVSLVSKIVSLLVFQIFLISVVFAASTFQHVFPVLSSAVIQRGEGLLLWAPGRERGSDMGWWESCIRVWNDTSSEDNQEALTKAKARINGDTSSRLPSPFLSWAGCHFRDEEIH